MPVVVYLARYMLPSRLSFAVLAAEGSAAYLLAKRALAGLRYSHELAGPIMEDLDPYERGATSPNPRVNDLEGLVLPLQRPPRRT